LVEPIPQVTQKYKEGIKDGQSSTSNEQLDLGFAD